MNPKMIRRAYLEDHKHGLFLSSLLILLFGNMFFPVTYQGVILIFLLAQNMIVGLLLIRQKAKWIHTLFYILTVLTLSRVAIELIGHSFAVERTSEILVVIYFGSVAMVIFWDLMIMKKFNTESVYSVFSGFILLCLAFGFILMFVNNLYPNSINGIEEEAFISDYIYFSFISLLTIGYGDITPDTELAKKLLVFASLAGHFYTVFVTALIVGKVSQANAYHDITK